MILVSVLVILANLLLLVDTQKDTTEPSAAKGKLARNSSFSVSVSFVCRNIYHLFGAIILSNTGHLAYPIDAYSLLCESVFTNLFCLKTNSSDWKRGPCNISQHNIECPLHGEYESYSQFFAWKISTYVVRFVYQLDGKQHITEGRVFTPYLRCHDISAIGPHDKMFKTIDHTHPDGDCIHGETDSK